MQDRQAFATAGAAMPAIMTSARKAKIILRARPDRLSIALLIEMRRKVLLR